MSEAWANITLKIPCSIEAEARMISCFLANKEMHPEIPIKLDAVVTRGDGPYGGWGVTAWLSDSEVFRSFDDDLQELCDAVFKQFQTLVSGEGYEERDGVGWVLEINQGKVDMECTDFIKGLSIKKIRALRELVS